MSDEKKLPAHTQGNNGVQLHDSGLRAGSLVEQSLRSGQAAGSEFNGQGW